MSDDEADMELLSLLRESFGLGLPTKKALPATRVLESAEYVCDNSIDVAIDMGSTKAAARTIWHLMQEKHYSTQTWTTHELHPKQKNVDTVNFIFTTNLSNFCFWSEKPADQRFAVEYKDQRWTGYWSLVASLQRALEEGIPITSSDFWQNEEECTEDVLRHIFRSTTDEEIPLLKERLHCLREAGRVLYERFNCSFTNCIAEANGSAAALVNLLVDNFPGFRDEDYFHGQLVRFYKRAQILVGDLWACFNGEGYGRFHDIDKITMFADYRIPQMLNSLGCLLYSPPLYRRISQQQEIATGENCEMELRGCSIWCVELIRRQILTEHPEAKVNAILIDFFLYDTLKEGERSGEETEMLPHHRTRSIWY